jgi:hypothetical protein
MTLFQQTELGITAGELVLKYIEAFVWPLTVLIIAVIYRGFITSTLPNLLSRSKIKISLFGVEFETSLPELESVTKAVVGGSLTKDQLDLLRRIRKEGPVSYEAGEIPKRDREWIRPIMNAGLIMTMPPGAHLGEATGLSLTPLGVLLMRGIEETR